MLVKSNTTIFSFWLVCLCFVLRKFWSPYGLENTFLIELSSRSFIVLPSTCIYSFTFNTFYSLFGIDCWELCEGGNQDIFCPCGYPALFLKRPSFAHCTPCIVIFVMSPEWDCLDLCLDLDLDCVQFCLCLISYCFNYYSFIIDLSI